MQEENCQDSDRKNLILTLRHIWIVDIFKVLINHSLWAFYYLIQLNWNKATFLWRNLVSQLVHLEYVLSLTESKTEWISVLQTQTTKYYLLFASSMTLHLQVFNKHVEGVVVINVEKVLCVVLSLFSTIFLNPFATETW